MADGDTIKFDQVADEAPGHIAGDLIFILRQIPNDSFSRKGDDLHTTMEISLVDSLIGFSHTIAHVDGHSVTVKKEDVTYCSEVVKISGEGMPRKGRKGSRGDLYVTLTIKFPKTFTDSQKKKIKEAISI